MAAERPSYTLEQQYPHPSRRSTLWSFYGSYRSLERAKEKTARLDRPCRIIEHRVIWRSIPVE